MSALSGLDSFVEHLRSLWENPSPDPDEIGAALGEDAYLALRSCIPLEDRRSSGIFFSGTCVCNWVMRSAAVDMSAGASVLDPACGAGDLLIACARSLPILPSLEETLQAWGKRLYGRDIHPELVEVAQYRLALLARHCGSFSEALATHPGEFLSGIVAGDGLDPDFRPAVDLIVMNPPFVQVDVTDRVSWGTGKTSLAPVFLDHWSERVRSRTRLLAVLPEVVRCGARYRTVWRSVQARLRDISVTSFGKFDPSTDVDVFLLDGRRIDPSFPPVLPPATSAIHRDQTIEDAFEVRVGPVVDYRDPHQGPEVCYLRARGLPSWTTLQEHDERRHFGGRTFDGAFVVVRRTSRPGDRYRTVATVVDVDGPVAVENHLIVLRPLSGRIEDCTRLMARLRSQEVNTWLNRRMRCRHLTVGSVREIPLGKGWVSSTAAAAA